jgi:hypothetical protein
MAIHKEIGKMLMTTFIAFGDLNFSIIGLGTEYPPHSLNAEALDSMSRKFYPLSPSWVFTGDSIETFVLT